jgi:hypothetical protein
MTGGAKVFIFLSIIVGVFLIAYIGTNVISVYQESMNEIEEDSESININCIQYSFDVELEINGKILMKLMNSKLSSFELDNVVMEYGEMQHNFTYKRFAQGDEKIEDITDFDIEDKFKIYPYGCATRAMECSLNTGVCK